jgi:hypothetical protein
MSEWKDHPINDPPIEEDDIGNALLGGFVGAATDFLANGVVDLGEIVIDEVGAYAVEHAVQMPSDQGPEAGAGGHNAAHPSAAAPGFNMEQDAAAPGFNMEQDAAAYGGVGLSDHPSPVIDASGGYTDVGLVDQYTLGGADTSAIHPYGGVGLADHGDSAIDGYVQAEVTHGSGDQGLGDTTHQSGQLDLDDTPDPGHMA